MSRLLLWTVVTIGICVALSVFPEVAMAQFAGGLENKVQGVTNGLINFLLPAASVIGLVYAAILAATGDASAKQRMVLVIVASVVGFLAPLIIRWLQGMAV